VPDFQKLAAAFQQFFIATAKATAKITTRWFDVSNKQVHKLLKNLMLWATLLFVLDIKSMVDDG
jgi:hypothetical protein